MPSGLGTAIGSSRNRYFCSANGMHVIASLERVLGGISYAMTEAFYPTYVHPCTSTPTCFAPFTHLNPPLHPPPSTPSPNHPAHRLSLGGGFLATCIGKDWFDHTQGVCAVLHVRNGGRSSRIDTDTASTRPQAVVTRFRSRSTSKNHNINTRT